MLAEVPGFKSLLPQPLTVESLLRGEIVSAVRAAVKRLEKSKEFVLLLLAFDRALNPDCDQGVSREDDEKFAQSLPPDYLCDEKEGKSLLGVRYYPYVKCFFRKSKFYLDIFAMGNTQIEAQIEAQKLIEEFEKLYSQEFEVHFLLSVSPWGSCSNGEFSGFSIQQLSPEQLQQLLQPDVYAVFPDIEFGDHVRSVPSPQIDVLGLSRYLWLRKTISARDLPSRNPGTVLQNEPLLCRYLNPKAVFAQETALLQLASEYSGEFNNFIRVNDCLCWDATHCRITWNDPTLVPGLKRIHHSGIKSPHLPLSLRRGRPDPETFRKLLDTLFDLFAGQRFEKLGKRGKKLKRALLFFERASEEEYQSEIYYVLLTIALEAILANEESEIAEKFSTRLALLLGNNDKSKIVLKELGKSLYKARSTYIHGSHKSDESINRVFDFLSTKRLPDLTSLVRRALLAAAAGEQFVEELNKSDNKQQKSYDGLLSLLDRTLFDATLHREYCEFVQSFWVPFGEIVGNVQV